MICSRDYRLDSSNIKGFPMKISDVKRDVRKLTIEERAHLAKWIIENLDETDQDEYTVNTLWRREVRKRIEEIKTGKVKMISSDEMWKDLFSEYGHAS